jgi:hypothetical protein
LLLKGHLDLPQGVTLDVLLKDPHPNETMFVRLPRFRYEAVMPPGLRRLRKCEGHAHVETDDF